MRKVAILVALLGTGVLAVGAVAIAGDGDGSGPNSARLNGYQEVASGGTAGSVSTLGFGSFHIKINRNMTADYVLSYRDVETPVTQAHIHFAQRSVAGPITVWLCRTTQTVPPGTQETPQCPPTSGTVRGTITPADVLDNGRGIEAAKWDEFVAAVEVGHMYANVHSTRFGGGEIRGQINDRDQKEYTGPPPFGMQGGDNDDD
jgi:CHRD domain